jgi:hypothetical protein
MFGYDQQDILSRKNIEGPIKTMNYDKPSYRQILEYALGQGYEFVDFLSLDLKRQQKQIILRHDIDYSPTMALEMAEIDTSYKIKSTFALLLSSPLYNPFTFINIRIINQIHQLGHNVVLHHYSASGCDAEKIREDIVREMQVMQAFFPYIQPVFVWHNPSQNASLSQIEVPNMANAYSTTFIETMHYISDSVLINRPKDFLAALVKQKFIHMLLHPVIWMSERGDMVSMISCALTRIIQDCDKAFMNNPEWRKKFPDGIPEEFLNKLEKILNES